MRNEYDIIILGAGVAGLACAAELASSKKQVLILESRNRIGGRICTHKDRKIQVPLELGAEFLHGDPSKMFRQLKISKLATSPACDRHFVRQGDQLVERIQFWPVLQKMSERLQSRKYRDRTVSEFMHTLSGEFSVNDLRLFKSYVEGFHAADLKLMSERGLAEEEKEKDDDEASKNYRFKMGYTHFVNLIRAKLDGENQTIALKSKVSQLKWQRGKVEVSVGTQKFFSRKLVITLPVGVLKNNTIAWKPYPSELRAYIQGVEMGNAIRMVFQFKTNFWEKISDQPIGFLHLGPEYDFPTWWSIRPLKGPFLVAWQGGPGARRLSRLGQKRREAIALRSLAEVTRLPLSKVRSNFVRSYCHDWIRDPHSLGAYSYLRAQGHRKSKAISRPILKTLYFAGEGTVTGGNRGTVHGAVESGVRAAQQILKSL